MKYPLSVLVLITGVSACSPYSDLQGMNPYTYYKEHPIENRVETRNKAHTVSFEPNAGRLTPSEREALESALSEIYPDAVRSTVVSLPRAQMGNTARREYLKKVLRSMGYDKKRVHFESAADLKSREARIDVIYSEVVPPRCPDWRASPVTTYSNTSAANFGCATTVNLGQMIANPDDLEKGKGRVLYDAENSTAAIRAYKGAPASAIGSAASSGATAGGSDSTE